jgi:hypothetical protein
MPGETFCVLACAEHLSVGYLVDVVAKEPDEEQAKHEEAVSYKVILAG